MKSAALTILTLILPSVLHCIFLSSIASAGELPPEPNSEGIHYYRNPMSAYIRCDSIAGECVQGSDTYVRTTHTPFSLEEQSERKELSNSLLTYQLLDHEALRASTERATAQAHERLARDPESRIKVTLWLWEEDITQTDVAISLDDANPTRVAEARRHQYRVSQEEVSALVGHVGGHVLRRRWLFNGIVVDLPANHLDDVLSHPYVVAAFLDDTGASLAGGDGLDRSLATGWGAYGYFESGVRGSRVTSTSPIVVGVAEWNNPLNLLHSGFKDGTGLLRVIDTDDCDFWGCSGVSVTTNASHGTKVSSIILGSLLNGQVQLYPGTFTTPQRERSGLAVNARMRYYDIDGFASYFCDALERAVENGVDVLNMSFCNGSNCQTQCANACNETYNPAGVAQALYAAEAAGMVLISSAGNIGNLTCPHGCTTHFPAMHTDVISVSGLADTDGAAFTDVSLHPYASKGFISMPAYGGGTNSIVPSVDLVGMYVVRRAFGAGSDGISLALSIGTSFAAPLVTSLAANFRQWLVDAGYTAMSRKAWAIGVNLLLMGDARSDLPGGIASGWVDFNYGYGFPRYIRPGYNMGSTFGWGTSEVLIRQGEQVAFPVGSGGPMPTDINGWKWVVAANTSTVEPSTYDVRVVDKCPPGGGTALVSVAIAQGRRYRIVLNDAASQIHGRCLEMQVRGVAVPDGGEVFWTADYYYSNNDAHHIRVP